MILNHIIDSLFVYMHSQFFSSCNPSLFNLFLYIFSSDPRYLQVWNNRPIRTCRIPSDKSYLQVSYIFLPCLHFSLLPSISSLPHLLRSYGVLLCLYPISNCHQPIPPAITAQSTVPPGRNIVPLSNYRHEVPMPWKPHRGTGRYVDVL